MFIVRSLMSRGAVRRAGARLDLNHKTLFRPAEPRWRLMLVNSIRWHSYAE